MNADILSIYKNNRKPYYSTYAGTGKHYEHQVKAIDALESARDKVKINTLWSENENSVRIRVEPDYDVDLDFLLGDSYNPEVNPDIQPHVLKRQEKEEIDRINREGVYGIIGEYKCHCCGNWQTADSVWGFVGDDWKEAEDEIKYATLAAAGLWEA